jgi:hypothetical protein
MYIGSWKIDDTVTFTVDTHDPTTGEESDADSDPTYRIYEDETGTAILTGTMSTLDGTNTVGHYSEQITLSAANGFEKGKSYNIRIRGIVGGVAGSTKRFLQIEAEVDANRLNWANIDNPTTAQNLSATNIDVDQIVASVSGAVGSVTGNVGGNVVGTVASVVGNIGGNVAGSVGSVAGAVGSVTGNVGGNVVGSVASVTGNVSGKVLGGGLTPLSGVGVSATIDSASALSIVSDTTNATAAQITSDHGSGSYLRNTEPLTAAETRTALGLGSANLDSQLGDLPTNAELTAAIITGLTTALTEGYRGTGATGSVRDLLYEIMALIGDHSISGTVKSIRRINGTIVKTYTLDSASAPTSITETS